MVNVRAICARDQHAIEGGAHDDRSRAADPEGPVAWRAGPVALPEPYRRPRRGRFSWPSWPACHACLFRVSRTYSEPHKKSPL
eukprot:378047-Prymnesium_polylepis.1